MRKLIMAVLLTSCCVAMSGCFTFDEEHNRAFVKTIRRDMMILHEDLDWMLLWDEESPGDSFYR
jgi:hypothetical protein